MTFRFFAILALVLAAVPGPAAQAVPTAAPSPLPEPTLREIGRVHASAFCGAVKNSVAPLVQGVLRNDEWIAVAHQMFLNLGEDLSEQSPRSAMDRSRADRAIGALQNNIDLMDKILNQPGRFPEVAATQDDRELMRLKMQLTAIEDSQKKSLDLISGAVETDKLGQMQSEYNHDLAARPENVSPSPAPTNGSYISAAGLPTSPAYPSIDARSALNSTIIHNTVWDKLAGEIKTEHIRRAQMETIMTPHVIAAARECSAAATPTFTLQPLPGESGAPFGVATPAPFPAIKH